MRELVKAKILANYKVGLDELNLSIINYCRESNHLPILTEQYSKDWTKNPDFDIQKFEDALTDEELLDVLDAQACLNYR